MIPAHHMPRKPAQESTLQTLVEDFVKQIVTAVEQATAQRVQSAVITALGGGAAAGFPRRRGRPPKNRLLTSPLFAAVRRRPKQLCPVPGCNNPAAPVFGMVCAKHKDVSKAQIKKYRADRRAAKEKDRTAKAA
jgi:hypothetical protein